MTEIELLEESVLLAVDTVYEQAKDQNPRMIVDFFKSAILKKYKDAFDQELMLGSVHRKNIVKAVDFCYSDICVSIRQLPELSGDEKERLINEGKQMKDVWAGGLTPQREKVFGKHPTQKPLYLLERIIDAASQPGDLIVDPFTGSSTTGVAALSRGRMFVGIDNNQAFLEISKNRLIPFEERSVQTAV